MNHRNQQRIAILTWLPLSRAQVLRGQIESMLDGVVRSSLNRVSVT
jgi:hypothetical protein